MFKSTIRSFQDKRKLLDSAENISNNLGNRIMNASEKDIVRELKQLMDIFENLAVAKVKGIPNKEPRYLIFRGTLSGYYEVFKRGIWGDTQEEANENLNIFKTEIKAELDKIGDYIGRQTGMIRDN